MSSGADNRRKDIAGVVVIVIGLLIGFAIKRVHIGLLIGLVLGFCTLMLLRRK